MRVTCTLNDNQKTNAKDWFMSNRWRINLRTNDNTFNDYSDLTIKDLK